MTLLLLSFSLLIPGFIYASFSQSQNNSSIPSLSEKKISNSTNNNLFVILRPTDQSYLIDEQIPITGHVEDITNKMNLTNLPIIIKLFSNDKEIYKTMIATNPSGLFSTTISPQETGPTKISAYVFNATNSESTISIRVIGTILDQWLLPIIAILTLISFGVAIIYRTQVKGLIIVAALMITSYIIIFSSSQNSLLNTILGTAILAPLITYVIDSIKKKNDEDSSLDSIATKYRDDHLKNEEVILVSILDEIARHRIAFELKLPTKSDSKYLATKQYDTLSIIHSNISNIPIIRIHQYYRNIYKFKEYFELVNDIHATIPGDLNKFKELYQQAQQNYSVLNNILYVNMLYNILESRYTYLQSFVTKFPLRYTKPFLWELLKAEQFGPVSSCDGSAITHSTKCLILNTYMKGYSHFDGTYRYADSHAIEKIIDKDPKFIYTRKNALKFIKFINAEFYETLDRVNVIMDKLDQIS